MSRDRKGSKFYLLIFLLFLELDFVLIGYSGPNTENSYLSDYKKLSTLEAQSIDTQDPEFDPLGLNFEPADSPTVDPQSGTEFFQDSQETLRHQASRSSNDEETLNSQRDNKNNPKVVSNLYQDYFDRDYPRGSNYSEIFRDSTKRTIVNYHQPRKSTDYSYTSFPNLRKIYKHLEVLEELGNGRAMIFPLRQHNGSWNIVNTNFGNEILTIRISSKLDDENPIIVVVAGIHGRDWYAIQSAIFLATELIINENRTREQDFDWWIVPVLNPDGYEISQIDTKWRDWEKNLYGTRDVENDCIGLDLDLNFDYQWSSFISIGNETPCDPNFPGQVPFSAPEARGLRDTLEAFSEYLDTFVALKEGRQMLVYPFSDTLESPRDVDNFEKIAARAVAAFGKHVEELYVHGQTSYLINISAGFIEDWAKIHLGIDKSFAFYLGPTTKDRRILKSQHLMDHMNGTIDLLNVIAHGIVHDKLRNSSSKMHLSLIYIAINFIVVR